MALFEDEEGDVAPFDIAEDGEDWFQFSLDNLEMDRGCSPLRQDASPMEQEAIDFGDTDQDDDVDETPHAGTSGPGPPDREAGRGGSDSCSIPRPSSRASRAAMTSAREVVVCKATTQQQQQQQQVATRGQYIPPPKSRMEKVKAEAKEMLGTEDQEALAAEAAAAKRSSRANRSDAKSRHRAVGGMAGGVGGMTGWTQAVSASSSKDRTDGRTDASKTSSTSTTGNGSSGGSTRVVNVQNRRRLERNAREQKRSLKISQRIEELRRMLTKFGVDVKASKSSVLSEATDYIAHLQRQHAQSEAERARLLTLLQNAKRGAACGATSISAAGGGGDEAEDSAALTPFASTNQTGVKSTAPPAAEERTLPFSHLAGAGAGAIANGRSRVQSSSAVDDFGACGAQPTQKSWVMEDALGTSKSSLSARQQPQSSLAVVGSEVVKPGGGVALMPTVAVPAAVAAVPLGTPLASVVGAGTTGVLEATSRALSHVNYEKVFRTVPMPMAIANVNGNLVDCNARLTQATGFRREEALFLSIFDLIADPFLQHTFSMISSILSLRGVADPPFFQVLGKRRDGSSAGVVQISIVQDDALRPLHFCICIMENTAGTATVGAGGLAAAAPAGTLGVAPIAAGGGFVTTRGVGDGRNMVGVGIGIGGGSGVCTGAGVSGGGGSGPL